MKWRHELKTWPEFFARVWSMDKRAELRRDDREFAAGDSMLLREFDPRAGEYTGREVATVIRDVVRDAPEFGLMPGFAMLSFHVLWRTDSSDPRQPRRES